MFVSFELTCGPLNVNREKICSNFAWIDAMAEDNLTTFILSLEGWSEANCNMMQSYVTNHVILTKWPKFSDTS